MKIVAIVQARMGSTRLPGKVMKSILGTPSIELLLNRLSRAKRVDQIVLATSTEKVNDALADHVASLGYVTFRGSESDVLGRYYAAAQQVDADAVVRITGDCPLMDPALIDACIDRFVASGADYVSNVAPATFPDGLDIEVFRFSALERANKEASSNFDREHVTPYIRETDGFDRDSLLNDIDFSHMRWTLDEPEDFEVISAVYEHFQPNRFFTWTDILELFEQSPEIFLANSRVARNEGADMGSGQKLWKRAKKVIAGGNMLLSKRPEMFLPEHWPSYYSKAKGCIVWDLDNRQYIDMSIMGIGTNTLGYGHPEVDEVVRQIVSKGNMSTLNCPEEVELAERLVELHPWSDMARFARTGGEANSVAIRIARAASGKDKVAICGYHGWHDWYLSANLGDDAVLAGHLLPGLDPKGVPENLKNTVYPFNYNDIAGLEKIISENDIGVIKMEVSRNEGPKDNFLQKVRELANKNNIVLVFDECTSGFRQSFGGLHKIYGVEPDMAIFGKALGNGYAITAILGRRSVMEAAQETFISSTFWTERIGPAAALKTLEVMEREKSWEVITRQGEKIKAHWSKLAERHDLKIQCAGLPALASFSFDSPDALQYKTLITQEMLKLGYLAGTSIYVAIEHNDRRIEQFIEKLDPIFGLIKECEDGRPISDLLDGPVCHSGFKRLN